MKRSTAKTLWLPLILIVSLFGFTIFPVSAIPIQMDTLGGGTDGSNPLQMDVLSDGSMSLWFWQQHVFDPSPSVDVPGYQHQYYGETDDWSWNTNIHFTDSAARYHIYTPDAQMYTEDTDYAAGLTKAVLGVGTQVKDGNSVTTTWTLHSGALQLIQVITYIPGSFYVEKDFTLTNLSDRTFTDVSLIHGGDTYFGGDDDASCYFNAANRMVYIRNADMTTFGLMGYSGGPETPADHYFVGNYWDGGQLAANGLLDDSVDPDSSVDAGYELQWIRPSLAPAESLSIVSYERITGASVLQVLAPAEASTLPGTDATFTFTLMNYGDAAADFTLSAVSEHGWAVSIPGGNTVTLPALGTPVDVPVKVSIPTGTPAGTADLLTLTAVKSDDPGLYASDATRTNVTAPPSGITSVTPGSTQLISGTLTLPVTIGTVSLPDGTMLSVRLLDNAGNPLVPPVAGTAEVQDDDGDGIGQALITLTLPENLPLAQYRIEVTVPETLLLKADAGFTVVSPSPTPIPVPDTGEPAAAGSLAGIAALSVAAAAIIVSRVRRKDQPEG